MKSFFFLMILSCLAFLSHAQPDRRAMDSIRKLSEADHLAMMKQLGISALRPGVNGSDPKASNAANYDEAKANPFPVLPDPLLMKDGRKVTSPRLWWNERRKEIIEDFDREVYGRVPQHLPDVNWEVVKVMEHVEGNRSVITKHIIGRVDNRSYPSIKVDIDLKLTTPVDAKVPVPVIMEFGYVFPPGFRFSSDTAIVKEPTWKEQVLSKGWGYAVLLPTTIQADNGAGLTSGIIGLVNKGNRRKPDDWGALRAWAWGASRALDYFIKDPAIDATKVGIEGHSRFGKAAAVAMAYDQRFAIAFISSSGAAGLKLHRRNAGEVVENIAHASEYHWMAGNYMKYAGPLEWKDLPVDAHQLIALCAPRRVFISSGEKGDGWVDARGMFMAGMHAEPVYNLLGKKGFGTKVFPEAGTGLMAGDIAYRQHKGGHTPGPNWPVFLEFAGRYFR